MVPGAGRVSVVQLRPDSVDAAGADWVGGAVVGRAGPERGRGALGPGYDAGRGAGSLESGDRLDAEFRYALPVGSQLVGTPRFGVRNSEYRGWGYSLGVLQGGATSFQFGLDARRRESLGQGPADHSLIGRLTASW